MNKDYLLALEQIEEEKGISREAILETLEKALIKSYEKNFDNNANVEVEINRKNGEINVYSMKKIVEEPEDSISEISLTEAKKMNSLYEIGDTVPIEVTPKNFGRIAAQTARNIVIQKIKDFEREAIYDDFIDRDRELINGTIQRIENGNLFIDLGKTEGIVPISEQVPNEKYNVNNRMKFYIKEVRNTTKGAQIILSRSCKELITRLFELEVPEIADGTVEIHAIAREAGSRTKIAVFTNESEIDPVGACVGFKGTRVKTIVDELNGEKIDIIVYNDDISEFISNSLSPSDVVKVISNEELKTALVIVPDDQLSLSIGKEGQNVRLAAKLTNWKIDIIGEEEYNKRCEEGTLEELFEEKTVQADESSLEAENSFEDSNEEEVNDDNLDIEVSEGEDINFESESTSSLENESKINSDKSEEEVTENESDSDEDTSEEIL